MTDSKSEYIAKAKENFDLINARLVLLEAEADKKGVEVAVQSRRQRER